MIRRRERRGEKELRGVGVLRRAWMCSRFWGRNVVRELRFWGGFLGL